jgi:hypothetical protein
MKIMLTNHDPLKSELKKLSGPAQQGLSALEFTPQGTKPSNTVPPTSINQSNTRILRTGVDGLYLSYQGEMHGDAAIRLSELKQLAQSDKGSDSVLAQFKVGEQLLEVLGHGRPPYTYVLVDGWFRLEVAKEGAMRLPMAYCKIASSLLTAMGHDSAVDALDNVISAIGSTESQPNVSRIDICADFITDQPLDQLAERGFVTKAHSFSRHTVARQFSGFSFSAGSPTSGRLYNKTLEMVSKNRPRPDLELQWRQNGWDGAQDVWRLEFQLRRETLAAFKLVPYKDAVSALPDLWKYATRNWLRHTLPSSTDTTQSRWSTSPFWLALQEAEWNGGTPHPMTRHYPEKGRTPSDEFLFINGLSTLTSFAAKEGYLNAGEAMEAYLEAAREFHDARSQESAERDRKKGADVDFSEYFRQKIESKRRSYNTAQNQPLDDGVHPADKAVAREYKKRSDGE